MLRRRATQGSRGERDAHQREKGQRDLVGVDPGTLGTAAYVSAAGAPTRSCVCRRGRRCGQALDSVISNGCIISGSRVSGEHPLCPNVRVRSFCDLEQAILMPGVRVGRHARILSGDHRSRRPRPRGAVSGTTRRKTGAVHNTDGGVVVVTAEDEPLIAPIDEQALQRGRADRGGPRPARCLRAGSADPSVSPAFLAARSSTRAATRPLKSTSERGRVTGARRGALGRLDRRRAKRSSCATATRPLSRQGRPTAVGNVNGEIATALQASRSISAPSTRLIALDGTPTKSRLGANAMLGVSMAIAQAAGGRWPAALRAYRLAQWRRRTRRTRCRCR